MTLIYRLLSLIINIFSFLIIIMLAVLLPIALTAPALLLPVFMLVAVVLYSWFSTQFRHKILRRQQHVKHSLRDWVRVNGIVALIFSFLNISSVIAVIRNPNLIMDSYKEMMKQYGGKLQQELSTSSLNGVAYIMLVWFIALFIHVLWTFALLKKNEAFFDKENLNQ